MRWSVNLAGPRVQRCRPEPRQVSDEASEGSGPSALHVFPAAEARTPWDRDQPSLSKSLPHGTCEDKKGCCLSTLSLGWSPPQVQATGTKPFVFLNKFGQTLAGRAGPGREGISFLSLCVSGGGERVLSSSSFWSSEQEFERISCPDYFADHLPPAGSPSFRQAWGCVMQAAYYGLCPGPQTQQGMKPREPLPSGSFPLGAGWQSVNRCPLMA